MSKLDKNENAASSRNLGNQAENRKYCCERPGSKTKKLATGGADTQDFGSGGGGQHWFSQEKS